MESRMMGNYHVRFGGRERRVLSEARPSRPNAEMGASFLCAEASISSDDMEENNAAYLENWLQVLKDDKKLIFQAASKAQAAVRYILDEQTSVK